MGPSNKGVGKGDSSPPPPIENSNAFYDSARKVLSPDPGFFLHGPVYTGSWSVHNYFYIL